MPKISIASLNVDQLIDLRRDIDRRLTEHQHAIEKKLKTIESNRGGRGSLPESRRDPRKRSSMLGVKITPKYRGPNGETWAGRGAMPRWMRKSGKKPEEFLIQKKRKAA